MSLLRMWLWRLVSLLRRDRLDRDMDEEIRFHLDMEAEQARRRGLPPEEAARIARRRFGGVDQVREEWRDQRGLPFLDALAQDVRYALRGLRRAPVFGAVAIGTLALGIGANAVIFSVLRGVLLEPLPYPSPERLVRLFEVSTTQPRFPVSPLNFVDYRAETRAFERMAAYQRQDLQLAEGGDPIRLPTLQVSTDYFDIVGASPLLGRTFTDDDMRRSQRVVILGERVWRSRFGADPLIAGRLVRLSGASWTVVGVLPAGVQHVGGAYRSTPHGETVDLWTPTPLDVDPQERYFHYLNVVARLKPGVTREQAADDLKRVSADLAARHEAARGWQTRLVPLREDIVGQQDTALAALGIAAGLVLLIACANLASLLLARASTRRREVAIRFALGASRGRLARQMLTESLLLATAGGVAGCALAWAGVPALVALMPADFPRLHEVRVDAVLIGFALGLSILTALLFGLAPAFQHARDLGASGLHDDERTASSGARSLATRHALVIVEVGLASSLLVGAGLLTRSFVELLRADAGFAPGGVMTWAVSLPLERYREPVAVATFYGRLVERLSGVPGVEAAGVSTALPWTGWDENSSFGIVGDRVERERDPAGRFNAASPGYFEAIGVPVVDGRAFALTDTADARPVVLVNRRLAETYFPGESAVGRRLDLWGQEREIVGVIGDVKDSPVDLAAVPAFYWPHAQQPFSDMALAIRTSRDPIDLVPVVRRIVAELDPELPLADVRPLDAIVTVRLAARRVVMALVGGFALLALALAAVGTYGLLAYTVQQRRREIGIRMALGADQARIARLVLRQSVSLTLAGLALGAVLVLAARPLLARLLYGITAADPATMALAVIVMGLVAVGASLQPARRAMRSDPVTVLRLS